jgi:hypothetical protein
MATSMHSLSYLLARARHEELRRQARPAPRGGTDRAIESRAAKRTTRLPHPPTRVTEQSPATDTRVN